MKLREGVISVEQVMREVERIRAEQGLPTNAEGGRMRSHGRLVKPGASWRCTKSRMKTFRTMLQPGRLGMTSMAARNLCNSNKPTGGKSAATNKTDRPY